MVFREVEHWAHLDTLSDYSMRDTRSQSVCSIPKEAFHEDEIVVS